MKKFFIRWTVEVTVLAALIVGLLIIPTTDDTLLFIVQCVVFIMFIIAAGMLFSYEAHKLVQFIEREKKKRRSFSRVELAAKIVIDSLVDAHVYNCASDKVYVLLNPKYVEEYEHNDWFDIEAIEYQTNSNEQVGREGYYFIPFNRILEHRKVNF